MSIQIARLTDLNIDTESESESKPYFENIKLASIPTLHESAEITISVPAPVIGQNENNTIIVNIVPTDEEIFESMVINEYIVKLIPKKSFYISAIIGKPEKAVLPIIEPNNL